MKRRYGPLAQLKRGLRRMTPNRVLARFISGGRHQTFTSIAKGYGRPVSVHRMADERKLTAAQRRVAPSERGRRAAAKKTAGSKASAYEAAAQIPARNRTAATKAAKGAAAGRSKQVAVQGKDGRFRGSVTLPGADLSLYRDVQAGRAVIEPGEPRRRRL